MSSRSTRRQRYLAHYIMAPQGEVIEHGAIDVLEDRIVAVHPRVPEQDAQTDVIDLGDVVLSPGLVNAHSHAFQRALRGRTEWLHPQRASEDFWSWREAMYAHALTYEADAFEEVTRRTFQEMLCAGITCVGEFHYVHHQPDGTPYGDVNELAHRVIAAARSVGIRITLLRVAYHRAGYGRPALPEQRRFISPNVQTFLEGQASLWDAYQGAEDVRIGVAPHSIRAVSMEWLEALAAWSVTHDVPLHIHACEQREEIRQSLAEYGEEPVHVLERAGVLAARATLVHATHLTPGELDVLGVRQAMVCACPTTERNLGDGFLPAEELLLRGVKISLGSDSHAHIDLWDEMRLVEYHERLLKERRNVLASPEIFARWHPGEVHAQRHEVSRILWPMGTQHGAISLGWQELGALHVGALADFITLDVQDPSLWGIEPAHMRSQLVFAATPGSVRDVFVGGARKVEHGRCVHG